MTTTSTTAPSPIFLSARTADLFLDVLLRTQENEHDNRIHQQDLAEMRRMLDDDGGGGDQRHDEPIDSDSKLSTLSPSSEDAASFASSSSMGSIRHIPEIMLEIYSFLPLSDRISTLARVDKQFAGDKVRSGSRYGRYGPSHLTLQGAVGKLQQWSKQRTSCCGNGGSRRTCHRWCQKKGDETTLQDAWRCGLQNAGTIYRKIFDPKLRLDGGDSYVPNWMQDLVSIEEVGATFGPSGENYFNRLGDIIKEAGFVERFRLYRSEMEGVSSTGDALARLDPGFVLTLPHSSKGREEHHAVSCSECGKLHRPHRNVACEHGHEANICKFCDKFADLVHSCSSDWKHDIRASWGCYLCKMKTVKQDVSRFRNDVRRRAETDIDFQIELSDFVAQVEDPATQEQILECLIRAQSPRRAFTKVSHRPEEVFAASRPQPKSEYEVDV